MNGQIAEFVGLGNHSWEFVIIGGVQSTGDRFSQSRHQLAFVGGFLTVSFATLDEITGLQPALFQFEESPIDFVHDALAVPSLDSRRGIDMAKGVAVEVVFVLVFFAGEEVFIDIVQGWLGDSNIRAGSGNDTINIPLSAAMIGLFQRIFFRGLASIIVVIIAIKFILVI